MPNPTNPLEQRASSRRQALASLITGSAAEVAAGVTGLYGLLTGGVDQGVRNIKGTRQALTYQPRDPSSLEALGKFVEPVAGRIEAFKTGLGDRNFEATGSPAWATTAQVAPDALLALLGARGAKIKGPTMRQMVESMPARHAPGSPQAQLGAIDHWRASPEALQMTREQFLGSPKITGNANASQLRPRDISPDAELVPFGAYQARFSPDGAAVYDGDKLVASYNFGDTLTVDKAHRGGGIGKELVYEWRTRYPSPATATHRTKAAQAIQEKVWDRIQREMRDTGEE